MSTSITASTFNANSVGRDQINYHFSSDSDRYREYRDITEWLSKLNFKASQSDFLQRHEKGTGTWLLESETFQTWKSGISRTLCCPGNPGAGKTILASIVINHLQGFFTDDNVKVACIYCNYKEHTLQTAANLIASLLKQFIQDSRAISDHVKAFYDRHQKNNTFPTLDEFTTALETEIKAYPKVFIVVDGLDECSESDGTRLKLLRALRSLTGPVNIMVTSRDLPSIEQHFREALRIDIRATDGDVTKFIESQLVDYPHLMKLREIIITKIVENVKGMFLLARLHMNMLAQQKMAKGVKKALDQLPNDINAIYDQAMDRIERQSKDDKELGERVLSWITYARRPLTVKELQHAFAVLPDMTELDPDDLIFDSQLTSVCAGLVVIDGQGVIRLAHYTTQQYFENQRESRFPNAEVDIVTTCLRYLSLDVFARGYCKSDSEFESLLKENPFLDYAARNWGHHACQRQECVKDLVTNFLQDNSKVAFLSRVMLVSQQRLLWVFLLGLSGVHMAAFLDLHHIVCYQLENGANPNSMDSRGRTPLHIAAMEGSQDAVMLLVARDDVDADSMDFAGQTPLSYAAEYGHEGVVKLLVARNDVYADSRSSYGRTPLSYAARFGREGVVKLLVAHDDVDADSKDSRGQTPLLCAAWFGREDVLKLLVARDDVDADSKDSNGRTPLSCAAELGQEGVVDLLVARDDVDADLKDSDGRTPLSYAAEFGHEGVVKLLVARDDVDADSQDTNGRTPLSYAAEYGREGVTKLLVARDDVDTDSKDSNGQTPLSYAAQRRKKDVVKLLLARDDVDADSKDTNGQTPLSYVALHGEVVLVKLLLARDDVDADSKDTNGRTPLSYAAQHGEEDVAKLLITRDDVEADSKDTNGRTPLSYAAEFGREGVVYLLVARDDVDADLKDSDGRTPLSYAAEFGQEGVVNLLVARDDVDADSRDSNGRTPLSYAAENGHEGVVKLLGARDDVDTDLKDSNGRTALSYATSNEHQGIVKLLVAR